VANVGTWRSPFPLRLGGNSHKVISDIYEELNANMGTALSIEPGSLDDIETVATARALSIADRAIERRLVQIDPMGLSTLLPRWEAILAIVPAPGETRAARVRRVAARRTRTRSSLGSGLSLLAELAFDPWDTRLRFTDNAHAVKYWLGGIGAEAATATLFWTSSVAHLVVEYIRPAGASDEDVTSRRAACLEALEEFAAAWATFDTSETQEGGVNAGIYGFFCDQPNIDVACLAT